VLKKENPKFRRSDENAVDDITHSVCTDLFSFLLQVSPEDDGVYPSALFIQEGVAVDDAEKLFQKLRYKVKGCVQSAMQLFAKMRSGRGQYAFDWVQPGDFQHSRMDIHAEQRATVPEKIMVKLRSCDVKVAFCIFPAFLKFGDDDGQNYERARVMRQANVIVDGLGDASRRLMEQIAREKEENEKKISERAPERSRQQSPEYNGQRQESRESNVRRQENNNLRRETSVRRQESNNRRHEENVQRPGRDSLIDDGGKSNRSFSLRSLVPGLVSS
jgi:hypothetical protein